MQQYLDLNPETKIFYADNYSNAMRLSTDEDLIYGTKYSSAIPEAGISSVFIINIGFHPVRSPSKYPYNTRLIISQIGGRVIDFGYIHFPLV